LSLSNRLSVALNIIAARLPERPAAYFLLFVGWFILLWILSSGHPSLKHTDQLPHFDKIAHFIYFYIGGVLLAMAIGLKWHGLSRIGLFFTAVLICSLIGRLDEYHQGFVPGRIGNDVGDWLADTLGALCGCISIFWGVLTRLPINNGCNRG
jgi:VanZ family protein